MLQLVSSSSPALQNDYAEQDVLENVLPQMRFARDCLAAGVGRLVFVSSGGAVYGPPRYLPIDEAHPTDPLNSHGLTKLMTEKYLGMLGQTRGLDVAVLQGREPVRPDAGLPQGPGARCRRSSSASAAACRWRSTATARRGATSSTSRTWSTRSARALDQDAAKGGVFNVGSGRARSVNEVLAAVEARLGVPIAREHRPARETDVAVSELAIGRAREVLGWAPGRRSRPRST